jgi:outer membrane cobalamin receptor
VSRLLLPLAFIVCCAWAVDAHAFGDKADSSKGDLPVHYLGEVVVTGKRIGQPPAAVAEVTAGIIEFQGATTAGEALSAVSGAWVSTGEKNSTEIRLRGFDSQHVLILVDGRPVNLPYYGDLDLSSLPVGNISKINVVKGPAASIYGSNTMGGIVNIVTKRVAQEPVGDLAFSFGTGDTWNSVFNYGSRMGRLDYWFSAGKSKSDGFRLPGDFRPGRWEDGDLRDNSDYDRLNLDGKLNYRISASVDLSLSVGYFEGDKGLPGGIDEEMPRYWRFVDWKRRYLDLTGESYLGDRWYVKTKLYYDGCKNRLIDYDSTYLYENRNYDSIHDSWDFGGSLLWTLDWNDDTRTTWGLNLRQDGIHKRMDPDEEWLTHKTITTSFFTQQQIEILRWASLDVGLAWNLLTSKSVDAKSSLDPSAGIWFDLTRAVRLRLALSRATRFPTLRHLYGSDSGNPDLKPESAMKLEAGIEFDAASHLRARMDFFRSDVKDLIDRMERGYQYVNLDQVVMQGIEVRFDGSIHDRLRFDLEYAYLDAFEDQTEYWLPYRPSHKVDGNVSYLFSFGLTMYATAQYVSRRVTPHPESEILPHYFVVNLRLSQALFHRYHPFVEIKNALDENYEEEKGFPMPGRTLVGGLKIVL